MNSSFYPIVGTTGSVGNCRFGLARGFRNDMFGSIGYLFSGVVVVVTLITGWVSSEQILGDQERGPFLACRRNKVNRKQS